MPRMRHANPLDRSSRTTTLASLRTGSSATVCSLEAASPHERNKLMALGLLPGAALKLLQRFPSYIILVGYTQIALDRETAHLIRVE